MLELGFCLKWKIMILMKVGLQESSSKQEVLRKNELILMNLKNKVAKSGVNHTTFVTNYEIDPKVVRNTRLLTKTLKLTQ